MKEETGLKLVQSFLSKNPCYTGGRKITVKGLMLHSVGCSQPRASVFIKKWNKTSYGKACVHGFIDANDGTVYQTLPWDHRGWHCGRGKKGSANNTHIGVEMCEPRCIRYTGGATFTCSDKTAAQAAVKRTYDSAVKLFAMLCRQYKLDPLKDGVIISHREGAFRCIASNHGDPEHLWKQLDMGYTMDGFRRAVKESMEASTATDSYAPVAGPAVKDCTVRVQVDELNIRKGPGTNYGINGSIRNKGVYTITAESDGPGASKWGKLKSGAGWISLDYCGKISASPAEIDLNQAIDKLATLGVINSPDYWKESVGSVEYLDMLFIKAAAKITGKGVRCTSVMAGVNQLVKDGIINTPNYWLECQQNRPNLSLLLCALGGAVKD